MEDAARRPARLAVLASGGGTNLGAILNACASSVLPATVVAVVTNRADSFALRRAADAGVRGVHLEPHPGEARTDYDTRLADVVADVHPDVVVLAGWMRILTMSFLGRFPDRVVNLHPALPGELPGTRAIERAWEEAVAGRRDRTGVMIHLVPDEGIDDGPVLATAEVPIDVNSGFDAFADQVHATEHRLLVDTLVELTSARSRDVRTEVSA
jgi:phosphoribosylglycinamide formyltransferase-1